MTDRDLINIAKEGMKNSYAPYSKFNVGAALLCKNGMVFKGCNIENSTYGATICAERTAIFKAVSEGEREFEKIAIVSSSNDETFPCGICRQVMSELMPNGEVLVEDKEGKIKRFSVKELLPHSFSL